MWECLKILKQITLIAQILLCLLYYKPALLLSLYILVVPVSGAKNWNFNLFSKITVNNTNLWLYSVECNFKASFKYGNKNSNFENFWKIYLIIYCNTLHLLGGGLTCEWGMKVVKSYMVSVPRCHYSEPIKMVPGDPSISSQNKWTFNSKCKYFIFIYR